MQGNWRTTRYQNYLRLLRTMWEEKEDFRAYIGLLLSLFAVSFFSIFALRPTLITIGELFAQIRTQREAVSQLDQKINNLGAAQATWKKILSDLPLIEEAMPKNPDPHLFARQTETLSKRQNVTLKDFSLGKITFVGGPKNGLQLFSFSFTVQGETNSVFSFLDSLPTLRRTFVWETLTIGKKKKIEEGIGSQLNLTVSGGLPYYK